MTDKTDNELIAEFMGGKWETVWWGGEETRAFHFPGWDITDWPTVIHEDTFQYNKSWDWLMPIVEKIESLGCIVEIWLSLGKGCRITHPVHGEYHHVVTEGNQTIEVIYKAVVSFIERHNHQPK